MASHLFKNNFLFKNNGNIDDSQRDCDDVFHHIVEGFPNFFYNSQENIKSQLNVKRSVELRDDNKSTKEIESKVTSILDEKLFVELHKISNNTEFDHLRPNYVKKLKLINNNNEKEVKNDSFIEEEMIFDLLPDDSFITIKQFKPNHNIALFISFNYDLSNHISQQECNTLGFHALFRDTQDHTNIVPIVKLVTDFIINCWTFNWNIILFITSESILPISTITALIKFLRVHFDRKVLEIIVIWPNAYERSRPWINEQCRVAKATACIQGDKIPDIVSQIMSYFDYSNQDKKINGTTLFYKKQVTTCYHEFNISYPAAMEIDNKIWLDAKQYFNVMKREMEKASLDDHDKEIFLENILRKALYNKFSQHIRLKHTLLSTRVSSIYFTQENCQCNLCNYDYADSRSIAESDPKILKAKKSFINILEEIRYRIMQEERRRIESEYGNLENGEKNLFRLDFM